jgi:hypothetical protein
VLEINGDFQITKFKANAQPYYIILDNDGMMLSDKPERIQILMLIKLG